MGKKSVILLAVLAMVLTAAPAASGGTPTQLDLANRDWEAPVIVEGDGGATQGLLDDDPNGLVPKTPFVQRYSLDVDHWEVWLCGATTLTMSQALANLEAAAVDYFDAMSGGRYEPTFTAGGSKPADASCRDEFLNGTYSTVGTPEGLLIIDSITGGGYASPGTICISTATDCPSIPSTFPGNRRYAIVGQNALQNFPMVAVHEIGHTLQWPHSFSGLSSSEYDNPIDLMSGNLTESGYSEPQPYGSLSYNRYQSGWVSPADVVVADGTYQAMTLEPFNVSGTQLFAIKTALDGEFYVLGTRKTSTHDPIPSSWQGVEVYSVDHYCDEPAFGGGICPGLYREHHQEPPNEYQLLHVLNPGEAIVLEGLTITVTGATATGYTLTSDPDPDTDTAPTAPTTPTATAGDGQAAFSWTAPGDGGSPILNYDLVVEDLDGGGSTVTNVGLSLSHVVTGLSNGNRYRARVRATNAVGDGPWSSWSADVIPGAAPSAPGTPVVSAGDGQISASWSIPSDNGGLAIGNYEVQINDETSSSTSAVDVGTSLVVDIDGLSNGHTYRVRVRAENAIGSGPWSGWSSSVTPSSPPSPPLSPMVSVTTPTSATAGWSPPNNDGGIDLLGYELVLENRTSLGSSTHDAGLATTLALTGLTTGDTYRHRVRVENADGWSEWSVWSPDFIPGTVPSAPGVPVASAGNAAFSATWTQSTGIGSPVETYELDLEDITTSSRTSHDVGLVLTHVFTGVANGDSYRVRARARNDSGWGPWSGWSNEVTPVPPPNSFIDDDDSVFELDIEWLAAAGITKGCNPPRNDMFCPDDAVTRGQMAAFLVRGLALSDDGGGNSFVDDDGSVFETDIAKLAAAGITMGCNPPANTNFCPDDAVTRGQMAAFLVRGLALSDDGGGNSFVDDDGSVFETDIAKLAAAGITKGCNPPRNDMFCPDDAVTRGQMAAFLHRALLGQRP